jgi:hypothetical protein
MMLGITRPCASSRQEATGDHHKMNAFVLQLGNDRIMVGISRAIGRASVLAAILLLGPGQAAADPARWRADGWKTDFSRTTVVFSEILRGGPPRDGIPPIDRPSFKPAGQLKNLSPREPVIVFPLTADARAYPLRVMTWHEIVNDTVGGVPVAVTYCPLCNAALVFDRRVGGRELDFGTTGLLRNSDLVMWDRQTESWWQQFTGEAIVGAYTGATLKLLPSRVIPFSELRERWPNAPVLVPNDPSLRAYGNNPYFQYEDRAGPYDLLFPGDLPRGLPAMARVVVARTAQGPRAVALSLLSERKRIEIDGIVFSWRAGQATALGAAKIADGHDVGTVEVTDASGTPLAHDVTFAFVLYAFVKDARVLTEKGTISLATGDAAR